ncbi:MAG: DNA-directed RNA polymerase subunit alpha [Spirochaetes bacterium]|nr:DNA-directed RNA polymerase subunit alpha [Spirochaetota bacterium]
MDKNILKDLKIPKNIIFNKNIENQFYGVFEVKPLEKGFGVTLGNSLRRVMYSVLRGWAIISIKIEYDDKEGNRKYVASEFDNIPFLLEDTIDFILNIKKLRIKINSDELIKTFKATFQGPTEIKGKDFEVAQNIEIVNKDLYVGTISDKGKIYLEFTVENNRGFIPAEKRDELLGIIGTIPVDAIFSPIKNVKYEIEPFRVGNVTDYEKLTIYVETDGTITPEDAIKNAAYTLIKYYSLFCENIIEEGISNLIEEENKEDKSKNKDENLLNILNKSLDTLEFTERVKNCFKGAGINTFRDLLMKTEADLSNLRNFGKKSLDEVKEKLESMGLKLGMKNIIEKLEGKK